MQTAKIAMVDDHSTSDNNDKHRRTHVDETYYLQTGDSTPVAVVAVVLVRTQTIIITKCRNTKNGSVRLSNSS